MINPTIIDTIEDLIRLLTSKDAQNRIQLAAELRLNTLRTRESLSSRGDLFEAASSPVNASFLKALVTFGNKEHDWSIQFSVIESLGDIGNEMATPFLSSMLVARPEPHAVAAAASLGEIGGISATKALIESAQSRSTCDRGVAAINALEGLAAKSRGQIRDDARMDTQIEITESLYDLIQRDYVHDLVKAKAKNVLELADMVRTKDIPTSAEQCA